VPKKDSSGPQRRFLANICYVSNLMKCFQAILHIRPCVKTLAICGATGPLCRGNKFPRSPEVDFEQSQHFKCITVCFSSLYEITTRSLIIHPVSSVLMIQYYNLSHRIFEPLRISFLACFVECTYFYFVHGFESEHRLFSHHSASAFSKLRSLAKCSLDDSVRRLL